MIDDLFPHPLVARTGRIENWIKNPDGRLPVSCTVFVVEDSIEGDNGIEASWRFVSHALRFGAGVAVHLSKIRPAGHTNDKGLVASGPVSFGKISQLLMKLLGGVGSIKMGHVSCILILTIPTSLSISPLLALNYLGSNDALTLPRGCGRIRPIRKPCLRAYALETYGSIK